jgi:hypothetical protein
MRGKVLINLERCRGMSSLAIVNRYKPATGGYHQPILGQLGLRYRRVYEIVSKEFVNLNKIPHIFYFQRLVLHTRKIKIMNSYNPNSFGQI